MPALVCFIAGVQPFSFTLENSMFTIYSFITITGRLHIDNGAELEDWPHSIMKM